MREAGKVVAEALQPPARWPAWGSAPSRSTGPSKSSSPAAARSPLFKGYPGKVPFPAVSCISINEQVVHGIPGAARPAKRRPVKIDTACKLNGWCADAAIACPLAKSVPKSAAWSRSPKRRFSSPSSRSAGGSDGREVARLMQRHVQMAGYSVVEKFVGHGIGRVMHEPPQVPNFTNNEMQQHDCPPHARAWCSPSSRWSTSAART